MQIRNGEKNVRFSHYYANGMNNVHHCGGDDGIKLLNFVSK